MAPMRLALSLAALLACAALANAQTMPDGSGSTPLFSSPVDGTASPMATAATPPAPPPDGSGSTPLFQDVSPVGMGNDVSPATGPADGASPFLFESSPVAAVGGGDASSPSSDMGMGGNESASSPEMGMGGNDTSSSPDMGMGGNETTSSPDAGMGMGNASSPSETTIFSSPITGEVNYTNITEYSPGDVGSTVPSGSPMDTPTSSNSSSPSDMNTTNSTDSSPSPSDVPIGGGPVFFPVESSPSPSEDNTTNSTTESGSPPGDVSASGPTNSPPAPTPPSPSSSKSTSNFCYRSTFTYKLLNASKANLKAVSGNLTKSVENVTTTPMAWAFGPDMGLQPKLGYNSTNADFGGFFDFSSVDDLISFYKEFLNNSYYLAYKPLLNTTTRIQTLHALGSDRPLKKGQIIALVGYEYPAMNATGYNLGEATRVLSNISRTSPAAPISSYEIDLSLHDTLYPANAPNYNLGIKYTFVHQADLISYYNWSLSSPERTRVVALTNSSYRLQFQLNNINPNLPNGEWGPQARSMGGMGGGMGGMRKMLRI